ncbi:MAG: hypothetical protein L6Q54_08535 [Leptospiraceae bacterium]|nr:hypothetical protein [Leptospiraceae bacterium]MCK6381280.1 hypothetical protein [Leptospiraceae bacterium]NUM40407.1 hypothetical protein [Leptospiraceae bacterium]
MKKLYVSIFSVTILFCSSIKNIRVTQTDKNFFKIPVKVSRVYIIEKNPPKNSSEEIRRIIDELVNSTIKKDISILPSFVYKEKGIYLDLKGLWTYDELVKEVEREDSYFSIFFFDTEKLKKHKKSDEVQTVRDLLLISKGLELDLFFESSNSCEVKVRFSSPNKLERELNNPYFIFENGKWYVFRLF